MNVSNVIYKLDTFGITQASLKMLRDTIAEKINNKIGIVKVPTNDLCCGYLIFDLEKQNATWTGDGFRLDGGGEGGAGYKSAEIFFRFFRIWPIEWEQIDFDKIYFTTDEAQRVKQFMELANEIAKRLIDEDFKKPIDTIPEYVR